MTMVKILADSIEGNFSLWVGEYQSSRSHFGMQDYRILLEGYQKIEGGIKYLVKNYQEFNVVQCKQDIGKEGLLSTRPYQLGQASDGSINCCVMALFEHFCLSKQLNPTALYKLAYKDFDSPDFAEIRKFADWQGVAYPDTWDKPTFDDLITSLESINHHALIQLLEEIINLSEKLEDHALQSSISICWDIEDVQQERPDLNDEQASHVLEIIKKNHDASIGVNWETIDMVAQSLYGDPPEEILCK